MGEQETIEPETASADSVQQAYSDATVGGTLGAIGGAVVGGFAGGPPGAFIGALVGAGASALAVDYVSIEDSDPRQTAAPYVEPSGNAAFKRPTGHDVDVKIQQIEGSPADALFPNVEYEQLIRVRAYENWNRRGRPEGTELEDWREAKRQIDLRHGVSDLANYKG